MDEQHVQDRIAQTLNRVRHENPALNSRRPKPSRVFGDTLQQVNPERPNRAKSLIENLMVAANGVTARFLDARGFPSLRRVVRSPERWDRIRGLAAEAGDRLPETPDSQALNAFLARRRAADPDRFVDLSTSVIKLIGSANTWSIHLASNRPAISGWRFETTHIRPRRTAGIRT
jgi:exoribonuclease-2